MLFIQCNIFGIQFMTYDLKFCYNSKARCCSSSLPWLGHLRARECLPPSHPTPDDDPHATESLSGLLVFCRLSTAYSHKVVWAIFGCFHFFVPFYTVFHALQS